MIGLGLRLGTQQSFRTNGQCTCRLTLLRVGDRCFLVRKGRSPPNFHSPVTVNEQLHLPALF